MQGAELNGLALLYNNCPLKLIALAGFRYWNFEERLRFSVNAPHIHKPTQIYRTKDHFHTNNNFYGGQIGLGIEYRYRDFFFNAKGKVALGAMCEDSSIRGEFITNEFNKSHKSQTFRGGYFALPSNIGHHKRTRFAVIPDVNVNVGYQVFDCLRIYAGYTFFYVNEVLWAESN